MVVACLVADEISVVITDTVVRVVVEVAVCVGVCVVVIRGDEGIRDERDSDDNKARARCRFEGGLIFGILIVIGTEMRARVLSQCFCLRDNHMA